MLFRQALSRRHVLQAILGIIGLHLWYILSNFRQFVPLDDDFRPPWEAVESGAHSNSTVQDHYLPPTVEESDSFAGSFEAANEELAHTSIIAHAPGWTIFRNLYMANGTLYILSTDTTFPEIRMMTSTGLPAINVPGNMAAREPTSQDMDFITPEEAESRWGRSAVASVEGNTLLFNDPPQFLGHYYHFVAELFFGAWAFWTGAWASPSTDPKTAYHLSHPSPPTIQRAMFPHSDGYDWQDPAGFNSYFLRAAFPSMDLEFMDSWEDRVVSTEDNHRITYVSRQSGSRRKLVDSDHLDLVEALEDLVARKGDRWELVMLEAESLTHSGQIKAAERTTILLGVHGNGLTHLVFMKPTRVSAVVEIFYPGGFAHDYEWTARALGMDHYSVWNDRYFTHPDEPSVDYPEGFQGNSIPVTGATVARLIEQHVEMKRTLTS
ncbi:hypothetical protein H0H93_012053 [Arthromyces matolae]|nr:hypothetical protein H0H93_012053 [Arthromyces matolae]